MMLSVAPTWARVRSKIYGRQAPLAELAEKKFELAPALEVEESSALALPGEFERVEGTRAYTSIVEQAGIVKGGLRSHLPTIAYRYSNVLLVDGVIYVRGGYERISSRRSRLVVLDRAQTYSSAVICADIGSDIFFGRWLCDSLAKELLACELGMEPINQSNPARIHEKGYRGLLGLNAHLPDVARIDDLLVVDDRGYNKDHVRRFRELRNRLRVRTGSSGPTRVYIARGRIAVEGRSIHNDSEVARALCSLGFTVIYPEEMTPDTIQAALRNARIVVAVEGSTLAHAQLAMPQGGAMITIQPSNRFSTAHKSVAEAAGLRFGYVVGQAHGVGLTVDIDRLCRTIELADGSV